MVEKKWVNSSAGYPSSRKFWSNLAIELQVSRQFDILTGPFLSSKG